MKRRDAVRRPASQLDPLERAKALSLVTARQDELRRGQLTASSTDAIPRAVSPMPSARLRACRSDPRLSDPSPASRPRPKPASPLLPPRRPSSHAARRAPPRPPPISLARSHGYEAPLIQLSPTRAVDDLDFDISSFDPLNRRESLDRAALDVAVPTGGDPFDIAASPFDLRPSGTLAANFPRESPLTAVDNSLYFINPPLTDGPRRQSMPRTVAPPVHRPFHSFDGDLETAEGRVADRRPPQTSPTGRVRCSVTQNIAVFTTSSLPSDPIDGSPSDNLMQFSMIDEADSEEKMKGNQSSNEYISLHSFDPLYSPPIGSKVDQSNDQRLEQQTPSLAATPAPPSTTPSPFGDRSSVTNGQWSAPGDRSSVSADGSSGELQDPFSVTDLTLALERKRRDHERTRLKRKAVLRRAPRGDDVKTVVKTHRRSASNLSKGQECTYECLRGHDEAADEEIVAFSQMVNRVKAKFSHDDPDTNSGLVISPRLVDVRLPAMTVKVVISASFIKDPATFTCDLSSSVDHLISYILVSIAEDLGAMSTDAYRLKVHGLSEYLVNESVLGEYEYVHQCVKLDQDIRFCLLEMSEVSRALCRTSEDDQDLVFVPRISEVDASLKVTREKLNILMETFYREVERLRDQAIQGGCLVVGSSGVVGAVKAICAVLYEIETNDVIKALQRLRSVTAATSVNAITNVVVGTNKRESYVYSPAGDDPLWRLADDDNSDNSSIDRDIQLDNLHVALEELTRSVKSMVELFCRTFHTDFRFESSQNLRKERKSARQFEDDLIVHISTLNRVPAEWLTTYERFKLICQLYYAGNRLGVEVVGETAAQVAGNLQSTVIWDEWVQFEGVSVSSLPRESRLCFSLVGVRTVPTSGEPGTHTVNSPLGWVATLVYKHTFELVQGTHLLGLWPGAVAMPSGTTTANTDIKNLVMIQVNLPDFDCVVNFPAIHERLPSMRQQFNSLHPHDQQQLQCILQKDSTIRLSEAESELLWEKRYYLGGQSAALPRVLQATADWQYTQLTELYSMLHSWARLDPLSALTLLLPCFADTYVRAAAVNYIRSMSDDELLDCLPQLVQAVKFENYHTGMLSQFLLERSLACVRIAHQLYWMLREAADDAHFRKRYELLFGALISVVGAAMRRELSREEQFACSLGKIAERVKTVRDRMKQATLHRELAILWESLDDHSRPLRLPLSPEMEVSGFDIKSCSYFSSNAFPLRLVLRNSDEKAESLYIMFKVGDDLRQDMLTMQLIRIMDKLWLQHGLDLKVITFKCQATGVKRGLVQLITETETLRKIQVKHGHGVTGSLKDSTISEWLKVQNPTELELQKAVGNFTSSCAAYCVATYLLGICDRHNDNIMVRQSGHLFHIDFGKFLGDSQMFGNIKRDRVPFVLSADMAYVINGGDRPNERFQHFVDLCCQAFNIVRMHGSLFLNIFSLMTLSKIPSVNENAVKYIQKVLLLDQSPSEATATFTRMIHDSLKSSFTQFNFIIHNLAQMKFSGHQEGAVFSFTAKTYSIKTDGRIRNATIHGYQKRYNPEKYYIYILRVDREKQTVPSFVFRRYSEFQELYHGLVATFPLVKLPTLSGKVILGRTHVKTVAAERKAAVQAFLLQLFHLSREISEHDIIYTFFHPMLRDEQDIDKTNIHKLKEPSPPRVPYNQKVGGQIKLSLWYKSGEFTVMIRHVKDLVREEPPDPYVKLYLLPDTMKITKRKTQIAKSTFHPTYNEMLIYRMSSSEVTQRTLQVTVWNYDALKENEFLGATRISLRDLDLSQELTSWYPLHSLSTAGAT